MTKYDDLIEFYKNISQEQFDEIYNSRSIENFNGEYWVDIDGFEGYYKISNFVRIKSTPRRAYSIRNGALLSKSVHERILKPATDSDGYHIVSLINSQGRITKKVHRLFGIGFIPNFNQKAEINHIDGIKCNNYPPNLEWNTRVENDKHGRTTGLIGSIGQTNYNSKLTSENVLTILKMIRSGVKDSCIAPLFGVQAPAIYKIKTGRKWSHLTGIPFKK